MNVAFFRFALSDSDDSDDSEEEENRADTANQRGESSVRSAQPLTNPHHTPIVKVNVLPI